MDILSYIVSIELDGMGLSAAQFNEMSDVDQMGVFNEIRFRVKAQLRSHMDLLRILDREIAKRLFDGCDTHDEPGQAA